MLGLEMSVKGELTVGYIQIQVLQKEIQDGNLVVNPNDILVQSRLGPKELDLVPSLYFSVLPAPHFESVIRFLVQCFDHRSTSLQRTTNDATFFLI